MKKVIFFLLGFGLMSCSDDEPLTIEFRHFVNDAQLLEAVISGDAKSDSFTILSVKRSLTALEVEVQYGGGCEEHDFQLIWDGKFDTFNERNIASVGLVHNSNGDLCEALLRQTITFDFNELFSDENPAAGFDLLFYDGWTREEYLMAEETIKITQGLECNLNSSFEEVACGSGFFDSNWFRSTDDKLLDGFDEFYYQPIEYDLDDVPSLGNYQLGIRILKESPSGSHDVICQAYPGYSFPIKIKSLCPLD